MILDLMAVMVQESVFISSVFVPDRDVADLVVDETVVGQNDPFVDE